NLAIISSTQPGLVRFIIQVFIILNFGSLTANILGSVQLAELLLLGIVGSVLVSLIFYQAIFLMTDIISLIMVGTPLNKSNIVRNYRPLIRRRFKTAFTILAIFWGGYLVLDLFNIQTAVVGWAINFVTTSVEIGELSVSLADILAFFLTIQLSIWISKFIRFIIEEEVYQRTKTGDKGVSGTISLMVRYTVISLGVVMAFAAAGIEFGKIAILVGALGVGIGFGLQSIFNNLVSGLILALERPIQVGDVVEVTNLLGVVKEIGFRASRIRTYEGAEVIVPNGDLISSQVINWTLSDRKRRLHVDVRVAHGSDPKKVLKVLKEAAEAHPDILQNPGPIPRFLGFEDSALSFQLLFWIPDFEISFRMGTEVTTLVNDHLKRAGIKIPFPQQDIHVKEIGGELKAPAKKPKSDKAKK
ncbi:MAG: mechanosensitive ion channel, partial [Bacteroidetes bacterium]|nr:mechanosensitive ion channel [Bacteroidota bacterium]